MANAVMVASGVPSNGPYISPIKVANTNMGKPIMEVTSAKYQPTFFGTRNRINAANPIKTINSESIEKKNREKRSSPGMRNK
jgi:hypothetical protein